MVPSPKQEESKENRRGFSQDPIHQLSSLLRKISAGSAQGKSIDQEVSDWLKEVKNCASGIILKFKEQKKIILLQFDDLMKPIAREILDGFLHDAKQLMHQLDARLEQLDQTTGEEWEAEEKQWVHFYSRWNDPKRLVDKILDVVSSRTKHLIDKDIRVIHEYQSQSLAHLPKESEAFKNVEKRLLHAIEEPLRQLMGLRNQPKEHTCLQQASDWVANLQDQRETYFNQLLMKIDHVMKDVVSLEEAGDLTAYREIEDEIVFMERELDQINADLMHLESFDEGDRQFILGRLESAYEHVEDLANPSLPHSLRTRMEVLKSRITDTIQRLHSDTGA